jgi:hypothetical protein
MIDHCGISEWQAAVIVKLTVLSRSLAGINVPLSLEVLMHPIPFPILLADRQAYIVRAHRMRGAVVATLIRDLVRWVSAAAR